MNNADDLRPATDTRGDVARGRNGPGTLSDRVQSLRLPARGGGGRGGKLPWVLCALLLASTVAFGFQAFRKSNGGGETAKGDTSSAVSVQGERADSGDVVLEAKGYVIPAHQIQVSPLVSGRILKLNFEEGKRVKKGEVLAVLEDTEYRADYDRAAASVRAAEYRLAELETSWPLEIAKAKAEWREVEAQFKQKEKDLLRAERLTGTGAQARRDYEVALSEKQMAERRMVSLEKALELIASKPRKMRIAASAAEVAAAEADLDRARWRLGNCTVKAPISGTILTKKAEIGNLVNPIAFNISASLCEMADLSDLEVDLSIQERDIARVVEGQECLVMPEAFRQNEAFLKKHPKGYLGAVDRLMPIADRAKGAIPVRVKVTVPKEEEGVYLKPDMSVVVSFKKVEK